MKTKRKINVWKKFGWETWDDVRNACAEEGVKLGYQHDHMAAIDVCGVVNFLSLGWSLTDAVRVEAVSDPTPPEKEYTLQRGRY